MTALPGVLGCRPLRRTAQVTPRNQSRGTAGRLPGDTPIFVVSRQQFMKYPGWMVVYSSSPWMRSQSYAPQGLFPPVTQMKHQEGQRGRLRNNEHLSLLSLRISAWLEPA
ncbi:MAG: hypothetical protein V3R70_03775 [Syntrophobacteria bacterium]